MKKIHAVIVLLLITFQLFAQTSEKNHEKYWYYRYRMKHYFSTQGEGVYQSLVSARRNSWGGDKVYYGDQTLDMGWYMGVLATEYDLLKPRDNQTELDQTLTELYYLMKAMERLDKCEGKEPYPNQTEALDGFFLRKDYELASLPSSSQQDVINNLNYKLNENDLFGWKPPGHPTYIDNLGENDTDDHFDMSQDQLIHLLIGYSAVL